MKAIKVVLAALRFAVFSVLMFLHPMIGGLRKLATLCLALAVGCQVLVPHYRTPLWVFLGLGIGLTALDWFYDTILAKLAPKDFMLVIQR